MVSSRSYKNAAGLEMAAMEYHKDSWNVSSLIKFLILVALAMPPGSSQPTPMTQLVQGYGALTQKAESQFWKFSVIYED